MSDARLDISPRPPTTGKSSAATITLASRQDQASLMIVGTVGGRSDMGYSVLSAVRRLSLARPARLGAGRIAEISDVCVTKAQFMIRLDACAKKPVIRLLRKRDLTT